MTDAQRLTLLKVVAICGAGLWILDYIVITPAMAAWSAQSDRIDVLRQQVARGQQLIERQDSIRNRWAGMLRANLPADISAAENLAFQAIDRWARASGISFSSLTPNWQDKEDEKGGTYQTLECRATATGTQAQVGRFIYELETDPIPVNMEEFELTSRDDHGAMLTMTARFTFLRLPAEGKGAQ